MVLFVAMVEMVAEAGNQSTVDSELESVSLIMPTNSRPEFVRQALRQIAKQEYPRELLRELIVVDDSPLELRRLTGLMEGQQPLPFMNVVYVALDRQWSIGAKRNLAVSQATGSVIVHWDDDDWYSTSRLRMQLKPIAEGKAELTLLEHSLALFLPDGKLIRAAHSRRAS